MQLTNHRDTNRSTRNLNVADPRHPIEDSTHDSKLIWFCAFQHYLDLHIWLYCIGLPITSHNTGGLDHRVVISASGKIPFRPAHSIPNDNMRSDATSAHLSRMEDLLRQGFQGVQLKMRHGDSLNPVFSKDKREYVDMHSVVIPSRALSTSTSLVHLLAIIEIKLRIGMNRPIYQLLPYTCKESLDFFWSPSQDPDKQRERI